MAKQMTLDTRKGIAHGLDCRLTFAQMANMFSRAVSTIANEVKNRMVWSNKNSKTVGTYTVTLTLPKESASGYLVLTVDDQEYYSDYLQRNDNTDQTLTFTLNVKAAKTVTFTARWGIYSGECHVKNGETLTIG